MLCLFLNNNVVYNWLATIFLMISLFRHGWKGGPNASRLTFYRIEMEYQRLVSGFSTVSSPFRIVSHVNNLEDPSVPFVILETSFLSKC